MVCPFSPPPSKCLAKRCAPEDAASSRGRSHDRSCQERKKTHTSSRSKPRNSMYAIICAVQIHNVDYQVCYTKTCTVICVFCNIYKDNELPPITHKLATTIMHSDGTARLCGCETCLCDKGGKRLNLHCLRCAAVLGRQTTKERTLDVVGG